MALRHDVTTPEWLIAGPVDLYVVALASTLAAAGLAWLADELLSGRRATVRDGWRLAWRRLPQVAGWALVVVVVGVPARVMTSWGVDQLGAILVGFGWSVLSFFVIPAIALAGLGPGRAMARSAQLVGRRWGGQVVGMVYVWLRPTLFLGLPGAVVVAVGVLLVHLGANVLGWIIAACGIVVLALAYALIVAANAVLAVALYRHAQGQALPAEFDPDRLDRVLRPPAQVVQRLARLLDTERTRRLRARLQDHDLQL